MDSFQTEVKPQDPENSHLPDQGSPWPRKLNFVESILTGEEKWIAFDNNHRGLQWLDSDKVPQGTQNPTNLPKGHDVRLEEFARNRASRSTGKQRDG